jgi:hypothetical protein
VVSASAFRRSARARLCPFGWRPELRFRAALGQAIAAGGERIEAVEATVQLKRRTKLPR